MSYAYLKLKKLDGYQCDFNNKSHEGICMLIYVNIAYHTLELKMYQSEPVFSHNYAAARPCVITIVNGI